MGVWEDDAVQRNGRFKYPICGTITIRDVQSGRNSVISIPAAHDKPDKPRVGIICMGIPKTPGKKVDGYYEPSCRLVTTHGHPAWGGITPEARGCLPEIGGSTPPAHDNRLRGWGLYRPASTKRRDKMPFFYVNIVTKGYDGALNLFFNDDIIALVDNIELADAIRKEISEKKKVQAETRSVSHSIRYHDWDKPYGYHTMRRHN